MKTAAVLGATSVSLLLAGASGAAAADSPVLSDNVVKAPVSIPVDVCGNTVNAVTVTAKGLASLINATQPLCPTTVTQENGGQEAAPAGGGLML